MPPKPKPTKEEVDAKIDEYKQNGYTYVSEDKIARTLTKLPAGTRIAYITKEDYAHRNGTHVGRVLRPGGWVSAKDNAKTPKWFSLFATGAGGRISWSVQVSSLEAILYRLKLEDRPRQPKPGNLEAYEKLQEAIDNDE